MNEVASRNCRPAAPPGAVAVIVAVPLATAVTMPVVSTRAFVVSLLVHVKCTPAMALFEASFAAAVSCCVAPSAVSVGVAGVTATVPPR